MLSRSTSEAKRSEAMLFSSSPMDASSVRLPLRPLTRDLGEVISGRRRAA
jgi:hypothetical protein